MPPVSADHQGGRNVTSAAGLIRRAHADDPLALVQQRDDTGPFAQFGTGRDCRVLE
jgi:hypothetical protein